MKKAIINVSLAMVLAVLLAVMASCKKAEEAAPPSAPDKAPPAACCEAKPVEAKPATAPAIAATSNELVPLPLVLPKPAFEGTPQDIRVPNLEKPLGKPRPDFYAPKGTVNVSLKKPVTASDDMPVIGELEMITDGDNAAKEGSYVELGPMLQHVTIDLGAEHTLYALVIWHYHMQARVYFDVVVQVANDPKFTTGVTTIFNNDHDNSAGLGAGTDMHYVETAEGKLIDAKGVKGRYVRLYSRGSTSNDLNQYTEVQVFGKP